MDCLPNNAINKLHTTGLITPNSSNRINLETHYVQFVLMDSKSLY